MPGCVASGRTQPDVSPAPTDSCDTRAAHNPHLVVAQALCVAASDPASPRHRVTHNPDYDWQSPHRDALATDSHNDTIIGLPRRNSRSIAGPDAPAR